MHEKTTSGPGEPASIQALLDALPNCTALLDEGNRITLANRAWFRFWDAHDGSLGAVGRSYPAALRQACARGEEHAEKLEAGLQKLRKRQTAFKLEFPCETHDELAWYEVRATPCTVQGKAQILISHENITLQRWMQQDREKLAHIVNQGPAVAFMWSRAKRWPVVYVSENVSQFGYSPEEFYSGQLSFADIIHPADLPRVAEEIAYHQSLGTPEYTQLYRILTKDQEIRWLKDHTWLRSRAQEEAIYHQGVVLDITEQRQLERALAFEQSLTEVALNQIDDIFFIVGKHNKLIRWNKNLQRHLGYADAEVPKMDLREFLAPQETAKYFQSMRQLARQGRLNMEMTLKTKTGRLVRHEISATRFRDHDGVAAGLCGVSRDISRRAAADAERKRLFAVAQDLICIANYDGSIIELNPAWHHVLGWSAHELKAKSFMEIVHPDDHEKTSRAIASIRAGEAVTNFENRCRCKDGSYRWLNWNATPYAANRTIYAVARDTTAARHASEALRQSEERYRTLFEESRDVVYFSTPEGKILDLNRAGLELFGYEAREQLLDLDIAQTLYADAEDRKRFLKLLYEHGEVRDFEVNMKRRDGTIITVLNSATAVYDENDQVVGLRGIAKDITELKKLQKQVLHAKKMQAIGTLAGGIAHDFNNILGAVLGYTELLREDLEPGTRGRANVEEVYKACLRAKDLVNQILTFSRERKPELKKVELEPVIDEVVRLVRASMPPTIELRTSLKGVGLAILGNASQLHQLLLNLCTNAYQAMRTSGGLLEVSAAHYTAEGTHQPPGVNLAPGKYVTVSVRDTGHGMDAETLSQIFDPFFTTKSVSEGTGLGLAVVHGIVKNHRGEIGVESSPGKGTKFTAYFPAHSAESEGEPARPKQPPRGKERILFVDDEAAITRVTDRILRHLGYSATALENPLEALALFKNNPQAFDLVISDLIMPEMNGIEFLQQIRLLRDDMRLILTTGTGEDIKITEKTGLRVQEILRKPLVMVELAQAIRRVLDTEEGDE